MNTASNPRLTGIACAVPGEPELISGLALTEQERERLPRLRQETVYRGGDQTGLMVEAAAASLKMTGIDPADVDLIITAPSLMAGHGLEIPAIAVKNALSLKNADTLNLQQGCNGVLKAMDLAKDRVQRKPGAGDVLIVAGCAASAATDNMTHGSFFWSDGAGAACVTARKMSGFSIESYAEASAEKAWNAMSVPLDKAPLRIAVNFASLREQMSYINSEGKLFSTVLTQLAERARIGATDIDAVVVPATGANRVPVLFASHPELRDRVVTDFRRGHMGGVDVLLALTEVVRNAPKNGLTVAALTASFTAQWGGVALRWAEEH